MLTPETYSELQSRDLALDDSYRNTTPYTPDFAYIDQALNLHIDIEIDEAYTYKGGEPTHYQEAQKDKQRNLFFLDRGWIVIP